jgi:excisionase family DNA binding protein
MVIVNKRLLNVKQAAEYIGISRAKLYQWMKKDKIISLRIDGRRLIDVNDLDEFVDSLKADN